MCIFLRKVMKTFCAQELKDSFTFKVITNFCCRFVLLFTDLNSDEITPEVEKKTRLCALVTFLLVLKHQCSVLNTYLNVKRWFNIIFFQEMVSRSGACTSYMLAPSISLPI